MEQRKISRAVISRLPRYYRYLGDLLEAGVERISSSDLSKKMHVTASQIRQDLNNFGGFGQQGENGVPAPAQPRCAHAHQRHSGHAGDHPQKPGGRAEG